MASTLTRQTRGALEAARSGATTIAGTLGVLWGVQLVNFILQNSLVVYGIVPRSTDGLVGIAFAPFLHGSWAHLVLNSVSLLILAPLTMLRRRSDFWFVSLIGLLLSGLGTWLVGAAHSVHIGASGVIFAYLGFLMARGWFERSGPALLLSVLVTWFFGGMVWGVLPTVGDGISWEAHLFGFLGGIVAARLRRT